MSERTAQTVGIGMLVVILAAAIAVYVMPSWRAGFLDWWESVFGPKLPEVAALYQDGAYAWYDVSGKEAVSAEPPQDRTAGGMRFPSGASLTVTPEEGLVWRSQGEKSKVVLIERSGLTREAWAVAPDGTSAVLFNSVTNAFDVFSITYEGAYLSYAGSFPAPTPPSYYVAVGYAADNLVVVHTGNPDLFELYRVSDGGAINIRSIKPPTP